MDRKSDRRLVKRIEHLKTKTHCYYAYTPTRPKWNDATKTEHDNHLFARLSGHDKSLAKVVICSVCVESLSSLHNHDGDVYFPLSELTFEIVVAQQIMIE